MLIKSFINDAQLLDLKDWIRHTSVPSFTSVGYGGECFDIKDIPFIPTCINSIYLNCKQFFDKAYHEPYLKDFVLRLKDKDFVEEHIDAFVKDYQHLRFNILITKPSCSCIFIHNGKEVSMDEKDLYILDTHLPHSIPVINSKKPLELLSFGFLIPKDIYALRRP